MPNNELAMTHSQDDLLRDFRQNASAVRHRGGLLGVLGRSPLQRQGGARGQPQAAAGQFLRAHLSSQSAQDRIAPRVIEQLVGAKPSGCARWSPTHVPSVSSDRLNQPHLLEYV
jgi:hypothetical protein